MAYSGVEIQLMKQADRFAAIKQAYQSAITGGTNFWNLVDNAADETYENRIKGTDISDLDSKFNSAKFGSIGSRWFGLHNDYYNLDLGITTGLAGYLDAKHWRIHEYFADMYYENSNSRLDRKYVFADQASTSNVLGTLAVGGTGQSLANLASTLGNTRLGAVVTTQTGGGSFKFDITVKTFIDSTSTLSTTFTEVSIPNPAPVGLIRMIGGQTVTYIDNSDTDTTVLNLEGTATGFQIGGYLLMVDNAGSYTSGYGYDETYEDFFDTSGTRTDDVVEYVQITNVSGTHVTVKKLRHSYNTFTQVMAYPCFSGVSALSLSSDNAANAGAIKLCPILDRAISL